MMNTVEFKTTRTNEKKEVIQSYSNINVEIDYVWDSHGDLFDWTEHTEEQTIWEAADVQIIRHSFTEELLGSSYDFEHVQLIVDGKVISGDLIGCTIKLDPANNKKCLCCRVTVGWG
jgi:hypothetical protein